MPASTHRASPATAAWLRAMRRPVPGTRRGGVPVIAGDQTGDLVKQVPTRQYHRGIVILRGAVVPWCDAAPLIKLAGSRGRPRRDTKLSHRPGIHDAAIPVPADNFAVIRRRPGSSPNYPLGLLFPGPDPRKMAARPACRISAGPYADNAAGRASWSTNPSAGGHSGDFEADNVTRGGHPEFATFRRHPWSVG